MEGCQCSILNLQPSRWAQYLQCSCKPRWELDSDWAFQTGCVLLLLHCHLSLYHTTSTSIQHINTTTSLRVYESTGLPVPTQHSRPAVCYPDCTAVLYCSILQQVHPFNKPIPRPVYESTTTSNCWSRFWQTECASLCYQTNTPCLKKNCANLFFVRTWPNFDGL